MSPEDVARLATAELDALIAAAVHERTKRPEPQPTQPPQQFEATLNPAWFVFLAGDNTIVQLRHAGHGWVCVAIPPAERAHLASLLLHHSLLRGLAVSTPAQVTAATAPAPAGGGGSLH